MGADWKNIVINTSPIKASLPARTPLQRTNYENSEAFKLVPAYNPEEAKKLIRAVEKDAGKKIPPIYLLDSNMSPNKDIAEVAFIMLKQIGVPLNLQLFSHAIWWEKLLRDPKLEWDMGGFGSGWLASPWYGFSYFKSDSRTGADGKSVGGYSNPELDRLVDIMAVSTDEGERTKAIQEAEKILLKDVACIPLLNTHSVRAWNKKVKGHVITDSGKINVTTGWGANVWIEK
jgi:ABC-type transport system substrate-binding protein